MASPGARDEEVPAGAALEIVGAYVSPAAEKMRFWAALSVVVCAMAMLARASVLTIRLRREHF